MRYPLLLFLALFLLPPPTATAQIDSTFIEEFSNRWRINGGLRFRDRETAFSSGNQDELILRNRGLAFRIGGRYRFIGYTFSIPISDLGTGTIAEEGSSLGGSLQLFRKKYFLNTTLRRTRGFVRESGDRVPTFREDTRLITAGVFGFYVANFRRFSLGSSFRQRNRQVRTSGSLLIGGLVNRQILTTDSLTIPLEGGESALINRFAQTKVGVGLGYAFTMIFGKHFYLTPMAVAGPEFRFLDYDPLQGNREIERMRMSLRIRGRLAIGYNGERNFIALTGIYLPSPDFTDNLNVRSAYSRVELRLGRRF